MKNFLGVIILLVVMSTQVRSQLPTGFQSTFATNVQDKDWNEPVGAVFPENDGTRLFIWEKGGRVYVCNRRTSDGLHIRQNLPVIDISDEVGNWWDHGLLGFALDPGFNSSGGWIYLYYVVDRHHLLNYGIAGKTYDPNANLYEAATIARITKYNTHYDGSGRLVADKNSRKILLGDSITNGIPILHKSHGVGSLAFARDGTLLATAGDGASYDNTDVGELSNTDPELWPPTGTYWQDALADGIITKAEDVGAWRSQMLGSLNGKLLRIDPLTGRGVGSNPFFDANNPNSARSKVWAFGFRNPFRMSIKPGAGSGNPSEGHIGEVFVGDVGFGLSEEFNIVTKPGQNFGWPKYEGSGQSADSNHSYWGYMYIKNREELRPICNDRDTLFFHELLRQDNAAKNSDIFSDCDGTTLIRSGVRYIHQRPALDWAHVPGAVFVPRFDADGKAIWPIIGTPESGIAYDSTFEGNASTGGIWYQGKANVFPPEYNNTFLLSDFGGRWIRRIGIEYSDVVTSVNNFYTNPPGGQDGAVVCMAENPLDGSIVYITVGLATTDHYGSRSAVQKITFGGNVPPIAKIHADHYFSPGSSLTVHFTADSSYDRDGTITKYYWNFGDPESGVNNESDVANPTHVFATTSTQPKMYMVTLVVEDDDTYQSQVVDFIVSLNNVPPAVHITSPVDGSKYRVAGDTLYTLEATVTDDPSQVLTYAWQTSLMHNEHSHTNPIDTNAHTQATMIRNGCSSSDTYHMMVTLLVTDDAGLSAFDKAEIYPECSTTLPLILRSFSVTQQTSVNTLKWVTELESNIEYFELERGYDGVSFIPINRQEARNGTGPNNYSYQDRSFSPGVVYYRVKIVEHGNIIRYSVIVRTTSEKENTGLKVVPNPVSGNFSVVYKSLTDDNVTIKVTDMTGRVLHTLKENVNRGQNVIYLQNLPNWPAGVYFLSVQNKDEIKREKFVKTR